MGGPRPLIRGEKKDGAENISGVPAPSWRTARRRRFYGIDQPVSLEKLRGIGGDRRRRARHETGGNVAQTTGDAVVSQCECRPMMVLDILPVRYGLRDRSRAMEEARDVSRCSINDRQRRASRVSFTSSLKFHNAFDVDRHTSRFVVTSAIGASDATSRIHDPLIHDASIERMRVTTGPRRC